MDQRLDHPPAIVPLKVSQLDRPALWQPQVTDTAPLPVARQVDLGVIASPGPGEHPGPPVLITEDRAQPHIVTPRLELADRLVPGRRQQLALTGIVRRLRLDDQRTEAGINEGADVPVEQMRADDGMDLAAACRAAIADVAVMVDGTGQGQPAAGAAGDPGVQAVAVAALVVTDATDTVRPLPQAPVDDRRPCVLHPQVPRPDEHAERRNGLHEPVDGGHRPALTTERRRHPVPGQVIGDLAPANPGRTFFEDAPHDQRRRRVNRRQAIVGLDVAVAGLPREPARARRPDHRPCQRLVGLVTLPLGHDEQQPEHRPADRGGRVDRLRDAHDTGAALTEPLDGCKPTDDGAGEPVDLRHDQPLRDALLDPGERRVHPRAVHRPARPVKILVDHGDLDAVRLRPALDRVTLLGRRLEALTGAPSDLRNPYVAVHDGHGWRIRNRFGLSAQAESNLDTPRLRPRAGIGGHMTPPRRFLSVSPGSTRPYAGKPHRDIGKTADDPELVARIAEARDIADEPEAVGPAIADEFGTTARQYASLRHLQDIAAREEARVLLSMEQRMVDARHRAKMRHVDVSHELHIVERDLDRARRGGRREPERAVRRLERVEAVLDCKPDLAA